MGFGVGACVVVGALLLVPLSSCSDYGAVTLASDEAGSLDGIRARGVGEACDDALRCRAGLVCASARCAPSHALDEGAACTISAECKDTLYCAPTHTCAKKGRAALGDTCSSEADCASGLRCNAVGLSAECQAEGAADLGAACKISGDCFGGLLCTSGACARAPSTTGAPPVGVSTWAGADCPDDPGPVRAYFRVPRGVDDGDFFRLPFPNDARKKAGKVDLSGFPTPGADILGYDLVDRWARYVEQSADGFSPYPSIVFRFSASPDFATMKQAGVIRMIDVTTASGTDLGFGWGATSARSKYVCANSITARPTPNQPLLQGHTYAVVVTNGAKAPDGTAIGISPDLTAVLGAADPGGPLAQAWAAYAPLRAWAAAAKFDLATLVNATVFTVGKHVDLFAKVAATTVVPATTVTGWVKCGAAPSPCPQADGTRACGAPDPAFDELHALVTLPTWQKGTAPYLTPADGGDLALDAAGAPTAQGSSQVCLALTVPKNAVMPAGGWPLAIYAHATGGSFRSHIVDGVAARLASADGGAAKIAVLGFDQVAHGTRRGASTARPEALVFATSNPQAMRGNALQAAADVLALARLAPTFTLAAAASPTGAALRFGNVVLVGHGQGANAVALAAPRAPVKGVVLAGLGASFLDSVTTKKLPVDFATVAPTVLGELSLTSTHPALTVLQNALDAVDPLDHASLLVASAPVASQHALTIYGRDDTYTPGITQLAYAAAAGLGIAAPPASVTTADNLGAPILPAPAGGNLTGSITAVVRQYAPAGYDGHFVALRNGDATRDIDLFVADALLGKTPMVGR
jgi:hypothetical protein